MADTAESLDARTLSVFDAYGRVDFSGITEDQITSLAPERRDRLEALFNASVAEKSAEQEQTDALAAVATRIRELNDAEEALTAARPQWAFLDEHRRAVRAHSGLPLDPAEVEAEKKAAAELQKRLAPLVEAVEIATSALRNARLRVNAARDGLRIARAAIAKNITAWQATFAPVTHERLVREAAARSQERLLGLANGTLSPPVKPKPPSKLDALLQDGGRGKSTRRLPSQR
jgi:hypothetical protein